MDTVHRAGDWVVRWGLIHRSEPARLLHHDPGFGGREPDVRLHEHVTAVHDVITQKALKKFGDKINPVRAEAARQMKEMARTRRRHRKLLPNGFEACDENTNSSL